MWSCWSSESSKSEVLNSNFGQANKCMLHGLSVINWMEQDKMSA